MAETIYTLQKILGESFLSSEAQSIFEKHYTKENGFVSPNVDAGGYEHNSYEQSSWSYTSGTITPVTFPITMSSNVNLIPVFTPIGLLEYNTTYNGYQLSDSAGELDNSLVDVQTPTAEYHPATYGANMPDEFLEEDLFIYHVNKYTWSEDRIVQIGFYKDDADIIHTETNNYTGSFGKITLSMTTLANNTIVVQSISGDTKYLKIRAYESTTDYVFCMILKNSSFSEYQKGSGVKMALKVM